MENNKKGLIDAILKKSLNDGEKVRLPCVSALEIAVQFDVNPIEIGTICNERRISQYQLGCFN